MTRFTHFLSITVCVALALGPTPVSAAPEPGSDEAPTDPNYERAVEAYRRGTELYEAADFEAALAAFEEAAVLFASPDFQFNIAKCHERLGNYEAAIRHYETYLRTAEDITDTALIEASIADLERRIQERDAAQDQPEPEPRPEPEPDQRPGRGLVIGGGVLLGVGVAVGIGGGVAFGLPVAEANSTLGEVLDSNPDRLTFAEADEIAAKARSQQALEFVMIGVGAALVVTGAALLGIGMAKNKRANTASMRLTPGFTPNGAGLLLSGSF